MPKYVTNWLTCIFFGALTCVDDNLRKKKLKSPWYLIHFSNLSVSWSCSIDSNYFIKIMRNWLPSAPIHFFFKISKIFLVRKKNISNWPQANKSYIYTYSFNNKIEARLTTVAATEKQKQIQTTSKNFSYLLQTLNNTK